MATALTSAIVVAEPQTSRVAPPRASWMWPQITNRGRTLAIACPSATDPTATPLAVRPRRPRGGPCTTRTSIPPGVAASRSARRGLSGASRGLERPSRRKPRDPGAAPDPQAAGLDEAVLQVGPRQCRDGRGRVSLEDQVLVASDAHDHRGGQGVEPGREPISQPRVGPLASGRRSGRRRRR